MRDACLERFVRDPTAVAWGVHSTPCRPTLTSLSSARDSATGAGRGTCPKATSTVGLHTGDLVREVVPPPSLQAGTSVGRLMVCASGRCTITTARHDVGVVQGVL